MEDNLNNFSSVELTMLSTLADMAEFKVLLRLHDVIVNEMKEKSFNEVPITEGERMQHAIRKGHKMAWDRDRDLKTIVNNFIKMKTKAEERKKAFDNK